MATRIPSPTPAELHKQHTLDFDIVSGLKSDKLDKQQFSVICQRLASDISWGNRWVDSGLKEVEKAEPLTPEKFIERLEINPKAPGAVEQIKTVQKWMSQPNLPVSVQIFFNQCKRSVEELLKQTVNPQSREAHGISDHSLRRGDRKHRNQKAARVAPPQPKVGERRQNLRAPPEGTAHAFTAKKPAPAAQVAARPSASAKAPPVAMAQPTPQKREPVLEPPHANLKDGHYSIHSTFSSAPPGTVEKLKGDNTPANPRNVASYVPAKPQGRTPVEREANALNARADTLSSFLNLRTHDSKLGNAEIDRWMQHGNINQLAQAMLTEATKIEAMPKGSRSVLASNLQRRAQDLMQKAQRIIQQNEQSSNLVPQFKSTVAIFKQIAESKNLIQISNED